MPPFQFKTKLNTFEASLNDERNFFKIGGRSYKDCINIAIVLKDGIPVYAKIPHLESEPECGVEHFLDKSMKDASVDFIRGSLQFVNSIFPTVTRFEFMDDSKIECNSVKQNSRKPPRKIMKPLSLAHLYLAKYGSTWYENKFNAKLTNTRTFQEYRDTTVVLSMEKQMSWDEFKSENSLSQEQISILHTLFETSKTWLDFFNSVPRDDTCSAFYMWLPFFINKLLDNKFSQNTWYIDIETMPKTDMTIISVNELRGGRRTRRRGNIQFSNNLSYGSYM
jgi:hypothetical protein